MQDQTGYTNPMLKIFEPYNSMVNSINNDINGMKNPLNSKFNQDMNLNNLNNNLNLMNQINNPIFPMMNYNNINLFYFFSDIGKTITQLQHDLFKVIEEISQLNLKISKIKINLSSGMNSGNINLINNETIVNPMMNNNNNLINSGNFNNNINNSNSMNNFINNTNMMSSGMLSNNIKDNYYNKDNLMNMNHFSKIDDEEIYVIFIKGETKTRFKCKRNEKINDIINKYKEDSLDTDNNIKFIYNGKELNKNITVSQAAISNNANIFVFPSKNN